VTNTLAGDKAKKITPPAGSTSRRKGREKRQAAKKGRKNGFISMKRIFSVLLLLSLLAATFGAVGYVIFFRILPA
jgi:hypothetical protein